MANTGLEALDSSVHKTNEWLRDLMEELHTDSRHNAYQALRATLHALRDRITVEEGAHLSAQLPLILRGTFYEGWRPSLTPMSYNREEFLRAIEDQLARDNTDPVHAARSVFRVVERYVTPGQVTDVKLMLPEDIRELWPAAA